MELLKTILYRIKNSNVVITITINPMGWNFIPTFKNIPTYADEWIYEPDLKVYRFRWMFLRVSFFIETGKIKDTDDWQDFIA